MIEQGLLQARDGWGGEDRARFLTNLGADPKAPFSLFFFSYPEAPVEDLARSLAADPRPLQVLAAPGAASLKLGEALARLQAPQVAFRQLPAVPQIEFDRLLWSADALIVRGEDSFVRAQLAAKPFLWTIYKQEENAHIVKLKAFMNRIGQAFTPEGNAAWQEMSLAWNECRWEPRHWKSFRDLAPQLELSARLWSDRLSGLGSLSLKLASLIKKEVQLRA